MSIGKLNPIMNRRVWSPSQRASFLNMILFGELLLKASGWWSGSIEVTIWCGSQPRQPQEKCRTPNQHWKTMSSSLKHSSIWWKQVPLRPSPRTGVIPTVVSPLGIVPKPHSEKLRLVVNMRYVNKYLVKRVFNFEGLSDIADMANKRDLLIVLWLHVGVLPRGITSRLSAFYWIQVEGEI